jgi:hypothetical protein
MLKRHYDWHVRLDRMLKSARQVDFEWGKFDCAMHLGNCTRCMTVGEVDVAAEHRGKYSDEAGAIAIFGSDLGAFAATIAASFEMEEVKPTFARRGDAVHVDNGTTYGALGIVALDGRFASCVSTKGHVHVPMHRWKRAWRVG